MRDKDLGNFSAGSMRQREHLDEAMVACWVTFCAAAIRLLILFAAGHGRSALAVLSVLIFDFLDYQTGRLDPSHAAIARKARMCERTVVTALQKLKTLGILSWLRRCREERGPWGIRFKQDTNAYVITEPPILTKDDPPPPEPHEWGVVPPLPDPMTQAVEAIRNGDRRTMLAALEADPGDELAMLWAGFYREMDRREAEKSSDLPD